MFIIYYDYSFVLLCDIINSYYKTFVFKFPFLYKLYLVLIRKDLFLCTINIWIQMR